MFCGKFGTDAGKVRGRCGMEALVSVIIPIYNTEKYLNNCIESVLRQTIRELQIILVDDGSTDHSPKLCDAWAKKDARIQVIHKANEGLGLTRNAGLDAAVGEYISFLDSDDTLDQDTYEKCIAKMEETGAKACYFGRKTMDKSGKFHVNPNVPDKLAYCGKEVKAEFAKKYFGPLSREEQHPYIQASACCVLYKRDVIAQENIRFCSERIYLSEDTFFNLDICKAADCVCILPENFYNYTYNAASLTKKRNSTKFERCKLFYKKLEEYARDFPEIPDVKARIQSRFIGYTRMIMKEEIAAGKTEGLFKLCRTVKKMCRDELVQSVYRQAPMEILDRNGKIYVNWVIQKRAVLLVLYYGYLK